MDKCVFGKQVSEIAGEIAVHLQRKPSLKLTQALNAPSYSLSLANLSMMHLMYNNGKIMHSVWNRFDSLSLYWRSRVEYTRYETLENSCNTVNLLLQSIQCNSLSSSYIKGKCLSNFASKGSFIFYDMGLQNKNHTFVFPLSLSGFSRVGWAGRGRGW